MNYIIITNSDYDIYLVIGTFIAAFAAVGGIALNNRSQNKQLRLHSELEILKILADEKSRYSRILVYEAWRLYKKTGKLEIFDLDKPKDYKMAVATVRADFDTVGSILFKRKEFLPDFLNTWLQPTIVCYKALKDNIENTGTKLNFKDYMFYFKWIYQEAESEWSIRYHVPSPEPF